MLTDICALADHFLIALPNINSGQEVNQHRDLRYNIPPKDARDRINRRATERAVHENLRRIEYDATHGPPGLRQFSSHLRQVVWPRNFKLEKLKNTTARKI